MTEERVEGRDVLACSWGAEVGSVIDENVNELCTIMPRFMCVAWGKKRSCSLLVLTINQYSGTKQRRV